MLSSKILIAVVTITMGATTAKADHYVRSCGISHVSYAPTYYRPVYAPAPVFYTTPVYYAPYRPEPVYYPRYYAPAPVYRSYYAPVPVYRSYYAPSSFGFGFGYVHSGHYRGLSFRRR